MAQEGLRKRKLKVGLPSSKKMHYWLHLKPFKNYEECFLFHLKCCFRSQDIQVFTDFLGM